MPDWIDSIIAKFSAGDALPWADEDMITKFELEAADDGASDADQAQRSEAIMKLAWALVHSRRNEDVQRGIAMLGASLGASGGPNEKREVLYLLAVGYYRTGDYTRSRRLVDDVLGISPDFRQAVSLKKMVEDKIAQDGAIGVGIAAAAVGIVVSGVAALLIGRKK